MEVNSKRCPFCGNDNNCGADKEGPCWCNDIKVPKAMRELIKDEQKMKACICKNCVESFKSDSAIFIQNLKNPQDYKLST